jgi:hypothetical protein
MTDETKRKRDELAEVYSGLFPTKSEWIEGKKDRHNYLSYEVKDEVEQAFSDGFDAGYAEGQAEIERLNKILRQEFNENDELGAEYLGITMVRSENKELRAKISIHEAKASQFESTLTETMRVRDEYKARLDKAVKIIDRLPLGQCHDVAYYDVDGEAHCRVACPACFAIRNKIKLKDGG